MPKVHEEAGCKFYIFVNDHVPPHVHVETGSGVIVLNIADSSLRRTTGAKISDVRKAQQIVTENRGKLQKAWDDIHGK
jgi:K+/H+ antiporter YhaU regulatory subunit KhtT